MRPDFKIKFYSEAFSGNVHDLFMVKRLTDNALDIFYQLLSVYLGCKSLPYELKKSITHSIAIGAGILELSISSEKALFDEFGITFEHTEESGQPSVRMSDSLAKLLYQGLRLRKYVSQLSGSDIEANVIIDVDTSDSSPSVVKTEKGNIILKDSKILLASKQTKESIDQLFDLLRCGEITDMRVEGLSKPMYFDKQRDSLIHSEDVSENLTITTKITGKINNLFFSSKTGTVISGDQIHSITWDDESKRKVLEFADVDNVDFIVKPAINKSDIQANVVTYEIVDCCVSKASILAS